MSEDRGVSRTDPRHPIRVVARRTGLKPDLIRAWERRYGAVAPGRSPTRRRYYSDAEIERLSLLSRVVRAGHTISQVAQLPNGELEELIARDATSPAAPAAGPSCRTDAILGCCLAAVQRLEPRDLGHLIQRASVELSAPELLDEMLVPLMQRIGDQWKQGTLRPFHEHMASAVVRSFLGTTLGEANHGAPVFVAATPARQRHELGALLATTCAAAEGWRVLYLGPDLPPEEIAAAALHHGAQTVALSLVYPPDDALLRDELRRLRRLLDPRTELIVGGRASAAYADVLQEIGALRLDDLRGLRRRLEEVRMSPQPMQPGTEARPSATP
ncbi:MAG TPA: MerR family transcriptional regulator [Thermoanaerobaculia bacterium]|nr:MerR family transcriptional regulator [Thermoanaerobaculia bacterium]